MPKIERVKKRHLLKKKEQRQEIDSIESDLGTTVTALDAKTQLESGILDDGSRVLLLDGKILFFEHEKRMFPTLRSVLENIISLPHVTVDMGAVKYVVNGADIMRPGIVALSDTIRAGRPVQVVEERHGKPLAIGIALFDAGELRGKTSGKVVKTIHYIGDDLWNLEF